MRLGLVLPDGPTMVERAMAAEAAGLPMVLIEAPMGTETIRAAAVAAHTSYVRIAVQLVFGSEDPVTLAEEVAVLDNLANGRLIVVPEAASPAELAVFEAALAGEEVRGVRIRPLPAQLAMPVWRDPDVLALPSDLAQAREVLAGFDHLFAIWDGDPADLFRLVAPPAVAALAERFLRSPR